MIINKDENSKREDILRNLDKCMLVEAGAGAGKTTLVVQRNIEQLKQGKLTAGQLADITFTNAAAEELRLRLLDRLHETESELPEGEEKERIKAAIRDESLIQISTIHSFCKRLLTEQSFAAKLPLDVKLLDDAAAAKRKKAFFTEWYKKMDSKDLLRLEEEFYYGNVGEFIYNSFLSICELPDDTVFCYSNGKFKDGEYPLDAADDKTEELIRALKDQTRAWFPIILRISQENLPGNHYTTIEDVLTPNDHGETIVVKWVITLYDLLNRDVPNKEWIAAYKAAFKKTDSVRPNESTPFNGRGCTALGLSKAIAIEANAEFMRMIGDVGKQYALFDDLVTYQNAIVINVARKAREAYRSFCRRPENRHEITNDALLQEALTLVKQNKKAREIFQNKFSCIYVDEFQDTDLVQRELIEILCGKMDDSEELRAGALFCVGDPKQSIYAFRGADVDVYVDFRKKCEADADNMETYVLDRNHRSEKPIIDWVNENFANKFDPGITGSGISYSPMEHFIDNTDDPKVIRGVYTLDYPQWPRKKGDDHPYDSKKTGVNKKLDSFLLTTLIHHLKQDGFKIWDFALTENGEKERKLRNIEYKDFLVLCLKKGEINIYADELKKAGIPTNLYGAIDNANDEILLRALQLFKALTYPGDRSARHGAMQVLVGDRITDSNRKEAEERLNLLIQSMKGKPAFEVLQYISHHLEYILTEEVTGESAVTAQSRMQQLLEYIQTLPAGDRQTTFRQMQEYMEKGSDKEVSLEHDQDAVRLMNLHKAKGLEGKIVIICARGPRKHIMDSSYRNMQEIYPSVNSNNVYYAPYMNDEKIISAAREKEQNERIRQDYVETTRAQEALIFMDALKKTCLFCTPDNQALNYSFDGTKKIKDLSEELKKDIEAIYNKKQAVYTLDETDTEDYDYTVWDPTEDSGQNSSQSRSITPSGMESSDSSWAPGKEDGRPYSDVFGTAMHRCFELMVSSIRSKEIKDVKEIQMNLESDIETIINQAIMEGYSDIADSAEEPSGEDSLKLFHDYMEKQLKFFISAGNSALLLKIISADQVYTELSFSQYADKKEIEGKNPVLFDAMKKYPDESTFWINGKADLVIIDQKEVLVVDYKTDHIGTKTLEELQGHLSRSYNNQQELYRFALSNMLDIPIENITYKYYHMYMDRQGC